VRRHQATASSLCAATRPPPPCASSPGHRHQAAATGRRHQAAATRRRRCHRTPTPSPDCSHRTSPLGSPSLGFQPLRQHGHRTRKRRRRRAAAALKAKLDTLVKDAEEAEEKAVAARCRARATCTLLEEQTTVALEKAAVAARQLVPSSSSGTTHTSPASSSYEETVVVGLHLQAAAVLNVRSLVNIVLDSSSTTYASWRDLMMMVLDHVDSDVASSTDPGWRRMDSVVLNWISNSITPELHQVVRERGATARHLWLAIENQFLSNREQRTLHLDAAFRNFVQGDLTVSEYCRKFKNMADALSDLGSPVDNRILVLNILRGLNLRFEHLGAMIRRYTPFPSFLKVRDDLILEELHLDSSGSPADATALYTCPAPAAARPPTPTPAPPSRPLSNGGTG
jgi:hypothetical protein